MHGDKTPMFVGLLVSGLIYGASLTLVLPADTPPDAEFTESAVAEDPPLEEKSNRDDLPSPEPESTDAPVAEELPQDRRQDFRAAKRTRWTMVRGRPDPSTEKRSNQDDIGPD